MANDWKKLSRGVALEVIEQILLEGAYTNIALDAVLQRHQLSSRDSSLVTEIVYGTISRKITLEWYLSKVIKDRNQLEKWVYYLLMMSIYQILYLDRVPNHAVVNDAVRIAKNRGNKRGADKLVNAVLRRFSSEKQPDFDTITRKNKRYSIKYSLPVWLIRKVIAQFGEERALSIFESLLYKSKASIRVTNPSKVEEIALETGADRSKIAKTALVKEKGHFAASEYFTKGFITVQDESSQLVAPTLAISGDEFILDACSAPGGKTMHMASFLKTGKIIAADIYEHKLKLVEENAQRLGLKDKIETKKMDAREVHLSFPKDTFDKILVDAPCSGMGLLRRKPDIRYRKKEEDLQSLQAVQLEILDSVCQVIKKNGIIAYSTCTIFNEENDTVIEKFLETHPNFEKVELSHPKKEIMKNGAISITPEQYLTDGFFIAQVKRIN